MEGSFLKEIDIYGNLSQQNVLYDEYISGRNRDLTQEEEKLLKRKESSQIWEYQGKRHINNIFVKF